MTSAFDSFDQSALGVFIQSALGVRGGGGDLYLGGNFVSGSQSMTMAISSGSSITKIDTPFRPTFIPFGFTKHNGLLYTAGFYDVAVLSNSGWEKISVVTPFYFGIESFGTNLYACGRDSVSFDSIEYYDGSSWSSIGANPSGPTGGGLPSVGLFRIASHGGYLWASGFFSQIGGLTTNCIARYNGLYWSKTGSGTDTLTSNLAIRVANNDLFALGEFTSIDGDSANGIAKWSGVDWSAYGTGLTGERVFDVSYFNGDLYAVGYFTNPVSYVAKWNGSSWVGVGSFNAQAASCDVYKGKLYVAGYFTEIDSEPIVGLASYNGSSWSQVGDISSGFVNVVRNMEN